MLADTEEGQSTLTKDSIISEAPEFDLILSNDYLFFNIVCVFILFNFSKFDLYFSNILFDDSFFEGLKLMFKSPIINLSV